jgi:hypothetical protein
MLAVDDVDHGCCKPGEPGLLTWLLTLSAHRLEALRLSGDLTSLCKARVRLRPGSLTPTGPAPTLPAVPDVTILRAPLTNWTRP